MSRTLFQEMCVLNGREVWVVVREGEGERRRKKEERERVDGVIEVYRSALKKKPERVFLITANMCLMESGDETLLMEVCV